MRSIALMLALSSCVTPSSSDTPHDDPYHSTALKWHQGSIEDAFKQAKKERKLVFLYWGAKWCPPCNELKAQVFSQPRFAELMTSSVPVYLDGDSEYAQIWGELLQVSGYPTILLLTDEKKELMRISESLTYDEFAATYLDAVSGDHTGFSERLEAGISGKATPQQWRLLAYGSWYGTRNLDLHSDLMLEKRMKLIANVPTRLKVEKAILSAELLKSAAEISRDSAIVRKLRTQAVKYLDSFLDSDETIFAARTTIIYSMKPILNWAFGKNQQTIKEQSRKRWLAAAEKIRGKPELSVDTRLWGWYPEIETYEMDLPKSKASLPELQVKVRDATIAADSSATSDFERQAVISGAAHLLGRVELYDEAAELLLREAKKSVYPYYYYSSLSQLEKKRGDTNKSLVYSKKASQSATGKSTKIQWLVQDINMLISTPAADKAQQISGLLEQVYNQIFAQKDGFSGRSYRSLKRLSKMLSSYPLDSTTSKKLKGYSLRCSRLEKRAQVRCSDHFSEILK